jgi:hypothetical protein
MKNKTILEADVMDNERDSSDENLYLYLRGVVYDPLFVTKWSIGLECDSRLDQLITIVGFNEQLSDVLQAAFRKGVEYQKNVASNEPLRTGLIEETSLKALGLNAHSLLVLDRANILTVGQLLKKSATELRKNRHCGWATISHIRKVLHERGLCLRDSPPYDCQHLMEDLGLESDLVKRLHKIGIYSVASLVATSVKKMRQSSSDVDIETIDTRLRIFDQALWSLWTECSRP